MSLIYSLACQMQAEAAFYSRESRAIVAAIVRKGLPRSVVRAYEAAARCVRQHAEPAAIAATMAIEAYEADDRFDQSIEAIGSLDRARASFRVLESVAIMRGVSIPRFSI